MDEKIDVKENNIIKIEPDILEILLKDRTTNKNIIWATNNYINRGPLYTFDKEIKIEKITSFYGQVIKPRISKSKQEQLLRAREKAEVFTPSWICNNQNNLIDNEWFNKDDVFNQEKDKSWKTNYNKIEFPENKTFEDYINELRLEVSCGEAPYLVSRYDTVTGDIIKIGDRIGLLDRKFRILNENVDNEDDWIQYTFKIYKSIYGFEWQGDNLLIARENLLYTFIDNYKEKFNKEIDKKILIKIAEIISWNLWQMDGIKFVIPDTCSEKEIYERTLFGDNLISECCKGCKNNNPLTHNGIYCKVMNWETNRKIKFVSLFSRRK
ncbi:MAG: restriction endonuclease subunit M [Mycoplasmatota bacterium]